MNFVLFPLENEAVVEVGSTTYSSVAASSGPVSLFIEVLSFLKKHIGNKTTEIISIRPCCCVDRMRTHCCSFPKSCPVFATPWTVSFPGFPVLHHLCSLLKLMYWVGDAIQPSHPLSAPSPPAFNLSQHQSLYQWIDSFHQVPRVLELQLQHQSFQWTSRVNFL